ncbi:unnamed protein product [Aureobasidium uvarum]|uniref:Polycomb protein VEFS-Box domain-containing protein n=1 Tax=Aureobasidium uvarum TaxID=2773716 RepID=A0A9N8PTT3_9PEZI|nr:unnamed protein product [Aureobasidium uvarum]
MNSVDDYRKYCGSNLVYDVFTRRQPVFLQRNLRKVLDHHEHNLNVLNHSPDSTSNSTATDMLLNNELPRSLPSMDLLSKATKPMQRTLKVHPKGIIKKRYTSNGELIMKMGKLAAKPEPSANPKWLPAPDHLRLRCNVQCNIQIHNADIDTSDIIIHTDSHLAELTEVKDDKGATALSIDMKPFIVTEEQMLNSQLANHNTNGGKRWRKERHYQAALSLVIDCFDSEDASQLFSILDPKAGSDTTSNPEQAQLRAYWTQLSASPLSAGRTLFRCRHDPEDQSKPLSFESVDYLLKADVSWTPVIKSRGTPLAMCNHIMQTLESMDALRRPRTTRNTQTCYITYVFEGGSLGSRTIAFTQFSCVFCPGRLPHPTFDRLHFHYLSFHDHFTFKVHKPVATDSNSVIRTVQIDLSAPRYERASDNVCDEREITWVKPATPFDLQKYILEGGYNTWASGKQLPLKTFPKTVKPGCMSKGIARLKAPTANGQSRLTLPDRQPKRGPPEEVREVQPRKREKYEVPDIPDVAVFRAESKREVEPGEMLSESDAEPDDSWLRVKHRVEGFPQLTGAAREFAILFDDNLQEEATSLANKHVCESVVRFVRRFAVRLKQPHLLQELKTKLAELKARKLIPENYIDYCLGLVAEEEQATADSTGEPNNLSMARDGIAAGASQVPPSTAQQSHNRLDVIMIDDSDTEPGAEVSPAVHRTNDDDVEMQDGVHHAPNACVCGKVASGSRKVITCRNIVSSSPSDHVWVAK